MQVFDMNSFRDLGKMEAYSNWDGTWEYILETQGSPRCNYVQPVHSDSKVKHLNSIANYITVSPM